MRVTVFLRRIRSSLFLASTALALLVFPPVVADAQFRAHDWELTLAATGSTAVNGDGTAVGGRVGAGYFLTDQIELGLRQQIAWSNFQNDGAFFGRTQLAADWNFDICPRVEPFVGVQGAFQYGDVVADSLSAGPEAGIRYFLDKTTFIYFDVEYDFFFRSGRSGATSDDQQWVYLMGIGVKL